MLKRTFQRGDDTNPKYSLFSGNILLILPIPDIIPNRLTYLSNFTEFLCFLFCFGMHKYMFKQLEISFLFMKKEFFFVNWKTTTFGDIKEYFPTVCKINEYFDCDLLLISSYSVFAILHKIFCLQVLDENLVK